MTLRSIVILALLAAPTAAAAKMEITVDLHEYSGGFHILPEQINARVGDEVTLSVTNYGQGPHNLVVCGDEPSISNDCADTWGRIIGTMGANETRPLPFTAKKAGTFQYWCYVPGHKGAGMLGTLVVGGGDAEKKTPAAGAALAIGVVALAAIALHRRRA